MKKTILLACVILAVLAGTALAQKGYTWQERARIDFLDKGAVIVNCVNMNASDSLAYGDYVDWDTTQVTVNDTTGCPAGTKYFGLTDTGCYGGAASVGNYNPNQRPVLRVYVRLCEAHTVTTDTLFVMGKDSTGVFQKDSLILTAGANAHAVSAKLFWELDSIQCIGAMYCDSLRIRYQVVGAVIVSNATANVHGAGVMLGRFTNSSTPAITKAGARQQLRVIVDGPAMVRMNGATTKINPGTPLTSIAAGVLGPDATVAVGTCAGIALEACDTDAALRRAWIHKQ